MKFKSLSIAVLACTAVVFAQSAPATTPATTTTAKKATVHTVAAKDLKVHGIVESTDIIGNQLVIKSGKIITTLDVTPETMVMVGGATVTLSDLKVGTAVMASYKVENGKNIAVHVMEKAAKVKSATATVKPKTTEAK